MAGRLAALVMATSAYRSLRSRALPSTSARWSNWAGNQQCSPTDIERPLTEAQLQQVVQQAAAAGRRVRVVGSGHSFTAIALSDDVLVSIEHLNLMRSIDRENGQITVQAGIELTRLNSRLASAGLAMTNLGDIAYQTLAGAISTGTHGTGLAIGGIATQVRGLRLVSATGDIVTCSPTENADLFRVARVGLGVFGIITEVTLAVEPAFNLHAVERATSIDAVLESWSHDVTEHDHFEFFWVPGTERAMTKANRRTTDPIDPQPKAKRFVDKILGENIAFGAVTKAARIRPSLIPSMKAKLADLITDAEYTDASHKVFASPRWVKFIEMEYSVSVDRVPTILRRIDDAVRSAKLDVLFPVEVRSAAADDISLSTAYGRDSGYIAVHRVNGLPYRPYFETVEAIMDEVGGRPHWGKMHFQTASTLAGRYPEWADFQRVRAEQDPTRVFANEYTDRVLGS